MELQAMSVSQFCEAHSISRTKFYALVKEGQAPRTFKVGDRTLISREAAAEWRAEMESRSAHQVGAK